MRAHGKFPEFPEYFPMRRQLFGGAFFIYYFCGVSQLRAGILFLIRAMWAEGISQKRVKLASVSEAYVAHKTILRMHIPKKLAMNGQKYYTDKSGKRRGPNRGHAYQTSLSGYDALTQQPWLSEMVQAIRQGDESLKELLPFRCPHYSHFLDDDHRTAATCDAEAFTFMTCVDIDEPLMVEAAISKAYELDKVDGPWQGLLSHMDYSARRKLHIDLMLPVGWTIEETQRAYAEALGVPYDAACITPERFIYITDAASEIYRHPAWYEMLGEEELANRRNAYLQRGLTIDGKGNVPAGDESSPNLLKKGENDVQPGSSLTFRGIPYADIISEWFKQQGGDPVEGERNIRLHQLAVNLRAICDNKKEVLMQVMPRLGLTEQELQGIVESACKEQPKGMSRMLQTVIDSVLRKAEGEESLSEEGGSMYGKENQKAILTPSIVKKMPAGLRESLSGIPQNMQMPVLCSILPLAAAYADRVEVEYCDGKRHRLGLESVIVGEQASNKSACKDVVDIWLRQMEQEDAIARQREEQWKERKKSRKANEKAPEDPKVIIRNVPVTISCSTLLKRLKYAEGHTLFSFGEELDTLRKTNGAGSWSSKYDIYRMAFDHGKWGQDYNSDQAESGVVEMGYNWSILGTYGALRHCFKSDNIENGLSSRILPAEMPDNLFAKMPHFKPRSASADESIDQAVTTLRSTEGFIDTPRLRKVIEKWANEKCDEAAREMDRVKDVYRRRAAVIGFRCGVIYHLLTKEEKETKACLEFALLMAEHTLQTQLHLFGEALHTQYRKTDDELQHYSQNHSIFDDLPPVFGLGEVRSLKGEGYTTTTLRSMICRWGKMGWIEKTSKSTWKKKCA